MNILTRRNAYDVPTIGRVVNDLFNDPFFNEFKMISPTGLDEGTLAVDVSEDDKHVFVRASLPGFKKENVQVEVHDGVLSIKAEQSEEKEETSERFYRRERRFGSMNRRIALPSTVVEGETKAELKDGVLTLRLPKSVKEQPRKIQIG